MEYRLIADSGCDMTPEYNQILNATLVPLTLRLGDQEYIDDETLDVPRFLIDMESGSEKAGSAAPAPDAYLQAFGKDTAFAVTLSGKLSGSYNSAMVARGMLPDPEKVHVFDSKSASAGELLILMKLRALVDQGLSRLEIIERAQKFIDGMKTYFVLENLENLRRNGRLNRVVAHLASILNIRPILGADGEGNIAFFSHARGRGQVLRKLTETIAASGKDTRGLDMVISHCNNPILAQALREEVVRQYHFARVLIAPTGGLSSLYAANQGVVIAF